MVTVSRAALDVDLLLQDADVRRAVDGYSTYLRGDREEPRLWHLEQDVVEAIVRLARRKNREPFDELLFAKKAKETRPLAAQPRVTHAASDLWRMLAQEEILQEFWPAINSRTGARGRHPGTAAKALLFVMASLGHSAHANASHQLVAADSGLQAVFQWIEEAAAAVYRRAAQPYAQRSYAQTLRQIHAVAATVSPSMCIETNIKLVKGVHQLLGAPKVRLGIDGMLFRAWVEQVGKRSPMREGSICRVATDAKPRMIESRDGTPARFV